MLAKAEAAKSEELCLMCDLSCFGRIAGCSGALIWLARVSYSSGIAERKAGISSGAEIAALPCCASEEERERVDLASMVSCRSRRRRENERTNATERRLNQKTGDSLLSSDQRFL